MTQPPPEAMEKWVILAMRQVKVAGWSTLPAAFDLPAFTPMSSAMAAITMKMNSSNALPKD